MFYEEERQKAKAREIYGKKHDPMTNWSGGSEEGTTRKLLAKKAGVGEGSIQRILAVYRNRPDLFKRDDLKRGQKAALVIRLFYEEMTQEAKANSLANLKQNTDSANLHTREMGKDVAEILGIQSRKKQALGTGQ